MDRGVFIDTGEGNEWADALRFLPWNADDRDGETFHNIAFASGRTSEGLRGGAPLVSPHTPATLQSALDAGEDGGKPDACRVIPDVLSLHSPTDTDEGQQDVI